MHIDVNCMSQNSFGFGLKSTGFRIQTQKASWRTLGIRNKQILYRRAKGKCEACGRKIDFDEMHSGHKNAASKGGSATLRNSVCICARCNKLQGTDSWATFMKKWASQTHVQLQVEKREIPQRKKLKVSLQAGIIGLIL